jgi:hypothetical protein
MAKNTKNNDRKFLRFASAGVQMAVLIYMGSALGKYLDAQYPSEKNWFTIFCVMSAVAISFYLLIKELPKD